MTAIRVELIRATRVVDTERAAPHMVRMTESVIIKLTSEAGTIWPALGDPPRLFQQALPGNRSIVVRALQSLIEMQIEILLKLV